MTCADGEPPYADGWPLRWDGVIESVVATLGPEEQWNLAALGLRASEREITDGAVAARTWGRTRTRHNFVEHGEGYVQFTVDPVDFVEAACSIREESEPILDSAAAWVHVSVTEADRGSDDGTEWIDWTLHPRESSILQKHIPTLRRGKAAIVEATVAASRLDATGYDAAELRERIRFLESIVKTAGGRRDRLAWERFEGLVDWRQTDP